MEGAQPLLRNVFVNYEGLIFRPGRIYAQSFARPMDAGHYRRPSRYAAFVAKDVLRKTIRVPDAAWIVDNFSANNYFHWMTECLPRLVAAIDVGCTTLLLPSHYRHPPYVLFTLSAFPEITRVGWVGPRVKVAVGELVAPRLAESGRYTSELREVAERVGGMVDAQPSAKLYISRANAPRRRLANLVQAAPILHADGFIPFDIDPADPAAQVQAFKSATSIVAVHGAELTNVMFMRPGGRVFEIRHGGDVFFDCFRPLAEAVGLEYEAVLAEPLGDRVGYEVNHADLAVDAGQLKLAIAG